MKEVTSIELASDTAMKEDIKKLEDTMAVEGIAPMVERKSIQSQRSERLQRDEELIAEMDAEGIVHEDPAPSQPVNVMEEFTTDVEVEGMGTVRIPTTPIGKVYTPPPANKTRNRVFESGLIVIKTHCEKVPIFVPSKIINVCNALQKKVGTNEFSIVCKGHWDDDNYVVGEEFKVPKQQVAGASVDYDLEHLEQLKLDGYNTVIHSHPFKSSNFSSSDDETINSHFQCSVLYSLGSFTTATIAVTPTTGIKLIITGDPKVDGEDSIVPLSESNNIEQKFTHNYTNKYVNQYQDTFWDEWGQPKSQQKHNNHGSRFDECEKEYDRYKNKNNGYNNSSKEIYDYDSESDIIYKNGKPVHRTEPLDKNRISARALAYNGGIKPHLPLQDHGSCGCGGKVAESSRVFRTEEPTVHANPKPGVFKTTQSPKNMDAINRQKTGKKK